MKNFAKILPAVWLSFGFTNAIAQKSDTLEINRNARGEISFARFKPSKNRSLLNAVNFLNTVLRAGSKFYNY